MTRQIADRRRSVAEWRVLLQEWKRSGQSRDEFARLRGLVPSTLRWWSTELPRRDGGQPVAASKQAGLAGPAVFLPVRVVADDGGGASTAAQPSPVCVEVQLTDVGVVRVPVGTDVAWVARLAAALLGGARC